MAPFWRDLNGCAGGNLYVATLSAGPFQWTVYEWEDVPHFGSSDAATFQVWVATDVSPDAGQQYFTYARLDNTGVGATVGAENASGTVGDSYFYNGAGTAPAVGTDLVVSQTPGGTATLTFQAEIDDCDVGEAIINRADVSTASSSDSAIAVTECVAN
jgi:hypothetical protein